MKKYFKNNKKFGMIGVFALSGFVLVVFLVIGFKITKAHPNYLETNIHPSNNPIYGQMGLGDYSASTYHWAWNDKIGWIDFHNTHSVNVYSQYLKGWASSSIGGIVLDCATASTLSGIDQCSPNGNWGVSSDGSELLSGFAWNDAIGWISFCGTSGASSTACPYASSSYRVALVSSSTGGAVDVPPSNFVNYAWNDAIGWISFNCSQPGFCQTSDYKVATDWFSTSTYGILDSAIIDTGVVKGAQINSIIWKGNVPATTGVGFQLAAATSTAELLTSPRFLGPNGSISSYYDSYTTAFDPLGVYRVKIDNISDFTDKRYFRYRVRLRSNKTQTLTPRVDEVTVNWSP